MRSAVAGTFLAAAVLGAGGSWILSPGPCEPGSTGCAGGARPHPMERFAQIGGHLEQVWGVAPAGALQAATEARQAMYEEGLTSQVPGASGAWSEYGRGSLVTDDPRYGTRTLGYGLVNGRVDSFDYDPQGGRLFASVGTGGVWMSTDLGEQWRSIGDGLPTQIIGAVGWTPAGGGTLVAGSGEPLMGGNTYVGMGAFWTADLGETWQRASGVPDGAMTFQVETDPSRPEIVYMATSKGLFRSADAGRSYVNVALPTSEECAGVEALGPCQFANFVTDVVVREPGGAAPTLGCGMAGCTCEPAGCPVLAAVGYRAGRRPFPDGRPHSPGNGLYRSETGEPGTFSRLDVSGDGLSNVGFTPPERIGRVELGNAVGPLQDHSYVYAIVQDAVLLNAGAPVIDAPDELPPLLPATIPSDTTLNGVYVSPDFGRNWLRMADDTELAYSPGTGSLLFPVYTALNHYSAGIQSWYNLWIKPDPTRQDALGVPTRLLFGLEEVWMSRWPNVPQNGVAQQGRSDFMVIGTYSCLTADEDSALCPHALPPIARSTTHPDQHDAIFIPDGAGGVHLLVGNDGGVYRQHAAALETFDNSKWGRGANEGFYTLLPYGVAVAKDGKVWFGLQDNGSGYIDPVTRQILKTRASDGTISAVDPDNSNRAYTQIQGGGLARTNNGGASWTTIKPSQTTAPLFVNPLAMDPTDPKHLITGGPQVVETVNAPGATTGNWTQVFHVGTGPNGEARSVTAVDVHGAAAYAAYCGLCTLVSRTSLGQTFNNGIATNVHASGEPEPRKASSAGWHHAPAHGLPNRYINALEIHPQDPRIVFAALGGYKNTQWSPPGQYLDSNPNLGAGHVYKSVNAGEDFVDISGNLPDVPVFWVAYRNGQLLAATQIGTFISTDTEPGTQWAPLGVGMPSLPVAHLAVHPGDPGRVLAATFGRGVWEYCFPGESAECNEPPEAALVADPPEGATVLEVRFDASASADRDGRIVSYTFDPGDGSPAVTQAAPVMTHSYQQGGVFHVTLRVQDNGGASAALSSPVRIVVHDLIPDPFRFEDVVGVDTGVELISNAVLITGITEPVPVSVRGSATDSGYSINHGPFTAAPGLVAAGDSVRVRHRSATTHDTISTTVLDVNGVTDVFSSTTTLADGEPDAFAFGDVVDVPAGATQTSGEVHIGGINIRVGVTVSGGLYSRNGGAWTSAPGEAVSGDRFRVRHTSAAAPGTAVHTTLTVGTGGDTFSSTTAADTDPDAFSFGTRTGVARSTVVTSVSVTPTGYTGAAAVKAGTGTEYSIGCAADGWTAAAGSIQPGQSVCVRHGSAATPDTSRSTSLQIGKTVGFFTTRTAP